MLPPGRWSTRGCLGMWWDYQAVEVMKTWRKRWPPEWHTASPCHPQRGHLEIGLDYRSGGLLPWGPWAWASLVPTESRELNDPDANPQTTQPHRGISCSEHKGVPQSKGPAGSSRENWLEDRVSPLWGLFCPYHHSTHHPLSMVTSHRPPGKPAPGWVSPALGGSRRWQLPLVKVQWGRRWNVLFHSLGWKPRLRGLIIGCT